MPKPFLIIRRYPYEEPHHTQLEIVASDGNFSGGTDFYCNVEDLSAIGKALQNFPKSNKDEFKYEYGSEDPSKRFYRYFSFRAYVVDAAGHCALQIKINQNTDEPNEGTCKFSIKCDAASINRLGKLFSLFSELKHLEFQWKPFQEEELFLYENHQK